MWVCTVPSEFKVYRFTFTGSNLSFSFLPPFITEVNFARKEIVPLAAMFFLYPIEFRKTKIVYNFGLSECIWVKSRPHFGAILSREANRKSQKLRVSLVTMIKAHGGLPYTLINIHDNKNVSLLQLTDMTKMEEFNNFIQNHAFVNIYTYVLLLQLTDETKMEEFSFTIRNMPVIYPKGADRIANSVDTDQTALLEVV